MAARLGPQENGETALATPRGWLVEALFQLLRSRLYQGLTVAEIVERAGVSRRTFYRLFPTKSSLLGAALDGFCAGFAQRLAGKSEFSFPTLARAFLGLWFDELATIRALDRDRLLHLLFDAMNASIPKVPGMAEDWGRVYGSVEMGSMSWHSPSVVSGISSSAGCRMARAAVLMSWRAGLPER